MAAETGFTIAFVVALMATGVRLMTPILLTAIGEVFAERSGVLNLSLEGVMGMSAFAAYATGFALGTPGGLLVAMLVGVSFGLAMAGLSVSFRLNQVIVGLSLWLLGTGMSAYLFRGTFGISLVPKLLVALPQVKIPIIGDIPVVGPILFNQDLITYAMYILIPAASVVLFKTSLGLKITASGEDPRAAEALGVNVIKVRYLCVILGAMLAGLAGAELSLSLGFFRENMIAGRGFIAIAVVIFGNWSVYRATLGAFIFAAVSSIQTGIVAQGFIQSQGVYNLFSMLPYVVTILALMLSSRFTRTPKALGEPYERGLTK